MTCVISLCMYLSSESHCRNVILFQQNQRQCRFKEITWNCFKESHLQPHKIMLILRKFVSLRICTKIKTQFKQGHATEECIKYEAAMMRWITFQLHENSIRASKIDNGKTRCHLIFCYYLAEFMHIEGCYFLY